MTVVTSNKWLSRLALAVAVLSVALIAVGASVTSTGSGDAEPGWPLSKQGVSPPLRGGLLYELGHRYVAGAVAILITVMMVCLLKAEKRPPLRRLGVISFIAVLLQAVLGGLRVLIVSNRAVQDFVFRATGTHDAEQLRIVFAVAHAFLGQAVLCMTFAIALYTSAGWFRWEMTRGREQKNHVEIGKVYWVALAAVAAIFVQLLIAALMRHNMAGLVIRDFPLSFGRLIPPFGNLPNNPDAPFPISDAELAYKVWLAFLHRTWAYVVAVLIIAVYFGVRKARRAGAGVGNAYPLSALAVWMVIAQILLGGLTIWTHLSGVDAPDLAAPKSVSEANALTQLISIAHVVVGATLLGICLTIALWLRAALPRAAASETKSAPVGAGA